MIVLAIDWSPSLVVSFVIQGLLLKRCFNQENDTRENIKDGNTPWTIIYQSFGTPHQHYKFGASRLLLKLWKCSGEAHLHRATTHRSLVQPSQPNLKETSGVFTHNHFPWTSSNTQRFAFHGSNIRSTIPCTSIQYPPSLAVKVVSDRSSYNVAKGPGCLASRFFSLGPECTNFFDRYMVNKVK